VDKEVLIGIFEENVISVHDFVAFLSVLIPGHDGKDDSVWGGVQAQLELHALALQLCRLLRDLKEGSGIQMHELDLTAIADDLGLPGTYDALVYVFLLLHAGL
jgi:hypothetical protein